MSKNLKIFTLCLSAGAVLLLLASHWIGTNIIYLAFFDPNRDEPMLVLQGSPAADVAPSDLNGWLEPFGGATMGLYPLVYMPEGKESSRYQSWSMFRFDQGSDVVRVLTDGDYPFAATAEDNLVVASYDIPTAPLPPVMVVWLVERAADEPINPLGLLDGHSQIGNKIYWRGAIESLAGDQWDDCVILGFGSNREATLWLATDETQLLRELINARTRAFHLSVYGKD